MLLTSTMEAAYRAVKSYRHHRRFTFIGPLVVLLGSAEAFAAKSSLAVENFSTKTMTSFWHDKDKVASLHDPPSPELLERLQEAPFRGGFEPTADVECCNLKVLRGSIPKDLVGSVFGNGPGRIRIGDKQYGHWFDGDGYVTRVSLDGRKNEATYQGQYVRTERYVKQQAQLDKERQKASSNAKVRRPFFPSSGPWTKRGQGRWWQNIIAIPTDPANTAVLCLPSIDTVEQNKPRIFACSEGGQPIEVDPTTLETIGDSKKFFKDFDVPSFFSAHWSKCIETGEIYNHGLSLKQGPGPKPVNVMHLDKHGKILKQGATEMPLNTFVHDSCISQNYLVYVVCPWILPDSALPKFLIGLKAYAEAFEWDESSPAYIKIISKKDLTLVHQIELPIMSTYHLVDAYEEEKKEDGKSLLRVRLTATVDNNRPGLEKQFADNYRFNHRPILTKLREYTFDVDKGTLISVEPIAPESAPCEFPATNAFSVDAQYNAQYIWTNAVSSPEADYLDGIQKVDTQTGKASPVLTFGDKTYCGSVAFVPKTNAEKEDDGYLVGFCYQALHHKSHVVIVDASSMELLCELGMPHHVPYPFHSEFWPGFTAGIE